MAEMTVEKKLKLKSGSEVQIRLMSWPTWQKVLEAASRHIGGTNIKTAIETLYKIWVEAEGAGGIGAINPENLPEGVPSAVPVLLTAVIDAINELSELIVDDALRSEDGTTTQELEFATDFVTVKAALIEFNPLAEMIESEKNFAARIFSLFAEMRLSPDPEAGASPDSAGSDSKTDSSEAAGASAKSATG